MQLNEVLCNHCQGAGLEPHASSAALCRFCGSLNELAGLLCPECEWVNADREAEACARCRRGLRRRCPGCSAANWSGADHCSACGHECVEPSDAMVADLMKASAHAFKAAHISAG